MNFVETLMSEKLIEKNPLIDVLGADRKVLQIACQDLTNYLKFHWDISGIDAGQCEVVERLEKLYEQNPEELQE